MSEMVISDMLKVSAESGHAKSAHKIREKGGRGAEVFCDNPSDRARIGFQTPRTSLSFVCFLLLLFRTEK
jgi:hypothetical protein